jgi:hypothetical protein
VEAETRVNADTYFAGPDLYDVMYAGFVADIGVWVDEAKAAGGAPEDGGIHLWRAWVS